MTAEAPPAGFRIAYDLAEGDPGARPTSEGAGTATAAGKVLGRGAATIRDAVTSAA